MLTADQHKALTTIPPWLPEGRWGIWEDFREFGHRDQERRHRLRHLARDQRVKPRGAIAVLAVLRSKAAIPFAWEPFDVWLGPHSKRVVVQFKSWPRIDPEALVRLDATRDALCRRLWLRTARRAVAVVPRAADAAANAEIARQFQQLAEEWRDETGFHSSIHKRSMHPSYQRIIGLGPAVIPILLKELQERPDDWFWALWAVTGANPVAPEDAGNGRRMIESWIRWGRQQGWM